MITDCVQRDATADMTLCTPALDRHVEIFRLLSEDERSILRAAFWGVVA